MARSVATVAVTAIVTASLFVSTAAIFSARSADQRAARAEARLELIASSTHAVATTNQSQDKLIRGLISNDQSFVRIIKTMTKHPARTLASK